jgi:hypothetical protein
VGFSFVKTNGFLSQNSFLHESRTLASKRWLFCGRRTLPAVKKILVNKQTKCWVMQVLVGFREFTSYSISMVIGWN